MESYGPIRFAANDAILYLWLIRRLVRECVTWASYRSLVVICALSYDSPSILTNKIYCTSKADALTWPGFKSKRYMLGNFMPLLSSAEFSFEKIV